MSTLSKKLFISVLTLILTVGAFTATTFAWFTLGNTASVNAFNAEVQSGAGLEVSYGESGEWFNTITSDRMNAYLAGDANVSTTLSAVSSTDGKAFTKLNANGTNQDPVSASNQSGFIEFTLKFRSLKPEGIVWNNATLGGTSVTFPSDIVFRKQDSTATTLNQGLVSYASNAARVSVTPITRAVTATPVIGNATVFEKAGGADNNIATGSGTLQADGAHDYYARKGNPILGFTHTNEGTGAALPITFTSITVAPTVHLLPTTALLTLVETEAQPSTDDYYYGEFVVRIWLEGWDADTFNAIFKAPLTVSLGFVIFE